MNRVGGYYPHHRGGQGQAFLAAICLSPPLSFACPPLSQPQAPRGAWRLQPHRSRSQVPAEKTLVSSHLISSVWALEPHRGPFLQPRKAVLS